MANWEAIFSDYKKCSFDSISQYVDEVKTEYDPTLRQQIEEGKTFLYIKKKFYEKYFKKYIPVAQPKKPTMKDWLEAKKKAQEAKK